MNAEKSLNPSSFLDLKAELNKRYESFHRAKLSQKPDAPRQKTLKHKHEPETKIKKVIKKQISNSNEETNEEELALRKSRQALEAKAKLYEKITSNSILIDDEDNEKYMVDFQRKVLYDTPVADKTINNDINRIDSKEKCRVLNSVKAPKDMPYDQPVISHPHIEKVFAKNITEESVHYQNVQFNEVRDHGTGYFAFSTDESKRKEQMEELNRMRQETENQRTANQRLQRKRKAMLEARLSKVCERRNIDKSVVQTYTKTNESEEPSSEPAVDLSSIPLPETPEEIPKKETKVRPWDIGKTDFPAFVPDKSKIRSQNDWLEEKRSERQSEFAPPSFYR